MEGGARTLMSCGTPTTTTAAAAAAATATAAAVQRGRREELGPEDAEVQSYSKECVVWRRIVVTYVRRMFRLHVYRVISR